MAQNLFTDPYEEIPLFDISSPETIGEERLRILESKQQKVQQIEELHRTQINTNSEQIQAIEHKLQRCQEQLHTQQEKLESIEHLLESQYDLVFFVS